MSVDWGMVGLVVLVAAGLVVRVPVPWGGSVPAGVAPVTATVALLSPPRATAALVVGVLVGSLVLLARTPTAATRATLSRFGAGVLVTVVSGHLLDSFVHGDVPALAAAAVAGSAMLTGDGVVSRWLDPRHRVDLQAASAAHVTLTCAGALAAVAVTEVGVAMAAIAVLPLLITRFSFERHAVATDTLEQTVQALGLVPELGGLVPLGHSERSATYALALAREIRLGRAATTRVVTATRLHDLGAVPLEGAVDGDQAGPDEIARSGARILREAGFPTDVADLLEAANVDAADAPAPTLEAAIVRVAATFDRIVGDDLEAVHIGVGVITAGARDGNSRRATAALLRLLAADTTIVREAIAAGARFREAAVGVELEAVTERRDGKLLPFARRS